MPRGAAHVHTASLPLAEVGRGCLGSAACWFYLPQLIREKEGDICLPATASSHRETTNGKITFLQRSPSFLKLCTNRSAHES